MIRLFITDLDGCVTHPFVSPHWEAISEIRKLNQESKQNGLIPPLTICSGRPMPYVEAVAQWLDIDLPFLFESGGGAYDVKTNELLWHPEFTDDRLVEVEEIKHWLGEEIIKKFHGTIPEFTKYTDAGLIHQDPLVIEEMLDLIEPYIDSQHKHFEVHHTDISINIILKMANKGEGIKWLCKTLGIPTSEVVYIGDSSGDVPAFKTVGLSYSPSNAKQIAKDYSEELPFEATEAVLEVYRRVIERNEKSE